MAIICRQNNWALYHLDGVTSPVTAQILLHFDTSTTTSAPVNSGTATGLTIAVLTAGSGQTFSHNTSAVDPFGGTSGVAEWQGGNSSANGKYIKITEGTTGQIDIGTSAALTMDWWWKAPASGLQSGLDHYWWGYNNSTYFKGGDVNSTTLSLLLRINNTDIVGFVNWTPGTDWHHMAINRDSSAYWRLFIDGVSWTASAGVQKSYAFTNGYYYIANKGGYSPGMGGFMDEFRMLIGDDSGWGDTGFTVPVVPYGVDALSTHPTVLDNANPSILGAGDLTVVGSGLSTLDTTTTKFSSTGSGHLDGSTGLKITSTSTVTDFGTGVFTIDFWVLFDSHGTGAKTLLSHGTDLTLTYNADNTTLTTMALSTSNSDTTLTLTTGGANWHHFGVVRDLSNNVKTYVDGVLKNTVPGVSAAIGSNSEDMIFGAASSGFTGNIEEIRVVAGENLSADFSPLQASAYVGECPDYYYNFVDTGSSGNIVVENLGAAHSNAIDFQNNAAIETAPFTAPPGSSIFVSLDNSLINIGSLGTGSNLTEVDSGGGGFTNNLAGPYAGTISYEFTGVECGTGCTGWTDLRFVPPSTITTGAFSLEFWFMVDAGVTSYSLLDRYGTTCYTTWSDARGNLQVHVSGNQWYIRWIKPDGTQHYNSMYYSAVLGGAGWHHFAICRDASGKTRIWVTPQGTTAATLRYTQTNTGTSNHNLSFAATAPYNQTQWALGRLRCGDQSWGFNFEGRIAEVIMTATEKYDATGYNLPTSPQASELARAAFGSSIADLTPLTSGSMDARLVLDSAEVGLPWSGDFTIALWIQSKDFTTRDTERQLVTEDTASGWRIYIENCGTASTTKLVFHSGTSDTNTGTSLHGGGLLSTHSQFGASVGLADNIWYHVAVTRSGNIVTLYFDGEALGGRNHADMNTALPAQDIIFGTGRVVGSSATGEPLNGYIDDLLLLDGEGTTTGTTYPVPTAQFCTAAPTSTGCIAPVASSPDVNYVNIAGTWTVVDSANGAVADGGTYRQAGICNINGANGGFNNNAYSVVTCTSGSWGSPQGCTDPDACQFNDTRVGTSGNGATQCGLNNEGYYEQLCSPSTPSTWGNTTSSCSGTDVCVYDAIEACEGTGCNPNCGTNPSESQVKQCASSPGPGTWGNWSTPCQDTDGDGSTCHNHGSTSGLGNANGIGTTITGGGHTHTFDVDGSGDGWTNVVSGHHHKIATHTVGNFCTLASCTVPSSCTGCSPAANNTVTHGGIYTQTGQCTPAGSPAGGFNGDATQVFTCNDGSWTAGSCTDPDACVYDSIKGETCGGGSTGTRVAVCTSSGNSVWGGWSSCQDPTGGSGANCHLHTVSGLSGTTSSNDGHTHEFTVDGSGNGYTDTADGHHHKIAGNTVANFCEYQGCTVSAATGSQNNYYKDNYPSGSSWETTADNSQRNIVHDETFAEVNGTTCSGGINNRKYRIGTCIDGTISYGSCFEPDSCDNTPPATRMGTTSCGNDGFEEEDCELTSSAPFANTAAPAGAYAWDPNGTCLEQSCLQTEGSARIAHNAYDIKTCSIGTSPANKTRLCDNSAYPGGWLANCGCVGNNSSTTYYLHGTNEYQSCGSGGTQYKTCTDGSWSTNWSTCETCAASWGVWHFDDPVATSSLSIRDNYFSLTTGLVDSGPNDILPFFPTIEGDPKLSTSQTKFSSTSSVYFDGSSSLKFPSDSNVTEITGESFTVDAWFRFDDTTETQGLFGFYLAISTGHHWELSWEPSSGSTGKFNLNDHTNGHQDITLVDDTWYHIALTHEKDLSSPYYTERKIYLNGILVSNYTGSSFPSPPSPMPFYLGKKQYGTNLYFTGYIDELRIVKDSALTDFVGAVPTVPYPCIGPAIPAWGTQPTYIPSENTRYYHLEELQKKAMHQNIFVNTNDLAYMDYYPVKHNGSAYVSHDGTGVDIVIVDTGVNKNHPHLTKANTDSRVTFVPDWPTYEPDTQYGGGQSHGTKCALAAAGSGLASDNPGGFGPGVAKGANIYSATVPKSTNTSITANSVIDILSKIRTWKTVGSSTEDSNIANPTIVSLSWTFEATTVTEVRTYHADQLGGNRVATTDVVEKVIDAFKKTAEPMNVDSNNAAIAVGDTGYQYPVHIIWAANNNSNITGWSIAHAALSPEQLAIEIDGITAKLTALSNYTLRIEWPKKHFIPESGDHASSLAATFKAYLGFHNVALNSAFKAATGLTDEYLQNGPTNGKFSIGYSANTNFITSSDNVITVINDTTFDIQINSSHQSGLNWTVSTSLDCTGTLKAALTDYGQGSLVVAGAHVRYGIDTSETNAHSSPPNGVVYANYSGHGDAVSVWSPTKINMPEWDWDKNDPASSHIAYTTFNGTSCSTPITAGLLALYLQGTTTALTVVSAADAKTWLQNTDTGGSTADILFETMIVEEILLTNIKAIANTNYIEIIWTGHNVLATNKINISETKIDSAFAAATGLTADIDPLSPSEIPLNWWHTVTVINANTIRITLTHTATSDISVTQSGNFKIGKITGNIEALDQMIISGGYFAPDSYLFYDEDDTSASGYFPYFPFTESPRNVAFLPYQEYGETWITSATINVVTNVQINTLTGPVKVEAKISNADLVETNFANATGATTDFTYGPLDIIYSIETQVSPSTWVISIDPSTGNLSGVPDVSGNYTFTVKADNQYYSATQQYNLTAADTLPCTYGSDPQESEPCTSNPNGSGTTGTRTRDCLNTNYWSPWSACAGDGCIGINGNIVHQGVEPRSCTSGSAEGRNNGTQTRTCDNGSWHVSGCSDSECGWSACTGEGCTSGGTSYNDTEPEYDEGCTTDTGAAGTDTRQCTNGAWTGWSGCVQTHPSIALDTITPGECFTKEAGTVKVKWTVANPGEYTLNEITIERTLSSNTGWFPAKTITLDENYFKGGFETVGGSGEWTDTDLVMPMDCATDETIAYEITLYFDISGTKTPAAAIITNAVIPCCACSASDFESGGSSYGGTCIEPVDLELLYKFDTGKIPYIKDETSNFNHGRLRGGAVLDTTIKKFGDASLKIDSEGSWLNIPPHASLELRKDVFTVDFWIYFNLAMTSSTDISVIMQSSDFNLSQTGIRIVYNGDESGSNIAYFKVEIGGKYGANNEFSTYWSQGFKIPNSSGTGTQGKISNKTWHHVAVTRGDHTTDLNTIKVYFNGVLADNSSMNTSGYLPTLASSGQYHTMNILHGDDGFEIGSSKAGFKSFDGYIDNFRIRRSLLWTANFTAPLIGGYFEGGCTDVCADGTRCWDDSESSLSVWMEGYFENPITGEATFDLKYCLNEKCSWGIGDASFYLNLPNEANIIQFEPSSRINTDYPVGTGSVCHDHPNVASLTGTTGAASAGTAHTHAFLVDGSGDGQTDEVDGHWHGIKSNDVKEKCTYKAFGEAYDNGKYPGRWKLDIVHPTTGDTDFYKEINPVGYDCSDTKILLKFNQAIDASATQDIRNYANLSTGTITAGSGVEIDLVNKKFGASSLKFKDEANPYVDLASLGSNVTFAAGTGFTVDFWFYGEDQFVQYGSTQNIRFITFSQQSGTPGYLAYYTTGAGDYQWLFEIDQSMGASGLSTLTFNDKLDVSNTAIEASTNKTWHHLTLIRDASNKIRLFRDGIELKYTVLGNQTHNIQIDLSGGGTIRLGGDLPYTPGATAYSFKGNIDEFRISEGARWIANFDTALPAGTTACWELDAKQTLPPSHGTFGTIYIDKPIGQGRVCFDTDNTKVEVFNRTVAGVSDTGYQTSVTYDSTGNLAKDYDAPNLPRWQTGPCLSTCTDEVKMGYGDFYFKPKPFDNDTVDVEYCLTRDEANTFILACIITDFKTGVSAVDSGFGDALDHGWKIRVKNICPGFAIVYGHGEDPISNNGYNTLVRLYLENQVVQKYHSDANAKICMFPLFMNLDQDLYKIIDDYISKLDSSQMKNLRDSKNVGGILPNDYETPAFYHNGIDYGSTYSSSANNEVDGWQEGSGFLADLHLIADKIDERFKQLVHYLADAFEDVIKDHSNTVEYVADDGIRNSAIETAHNFRILYSYWSSLLESFPAFASQFDSYSKNRHATKNDWAGLPKQTCGYNGLDIRFRTDQTAENEKLYIDIVYNFSLSSISGVEIDFSKFIDTLTDLGYVADLFPDAIIDSLSWSGDARDNNYLQAFSKTTNKYICVYGGDVSDSTTSPTKKYLRSDSSQDKLPILTTIVLDITGGSWIDKVFLQVAGVNEQVFGIDNTVATWATSVFWGLYLTLIQSIWSAKFVSNERTTDIIHYEGLPNWTGNSYKADIDDNIDIRDLLTTMILAVEPTSHSGVKATGEIVQKTQLTNTETFTLIDTNGDSVTFEADNTTATTDGSVNGSGKVIIGIQNNASIVDDIKDIVTAINVVSAGAAQPADVTGKVRHHLRIHATTSVYISSLILLTQEVAGSAGNTTIDVSGSGGDLEAVNFIGGTDGEVTTVNLSETNIESIIKLPSSATYSDGTYKTVKEYYNLNSLDLTDISYSTVKDTVSGKLPWVDSDSGDRILSTIDANNDGVVDITDVVTLRNVWTALGEYPATLEQVSVNSLTIVPDKPCTVFDFKADLYTVDGCSTLCITDPDCFSKIWISDLLVIRDTENNADNYLLEISYSVDYSFVDTNTYSVEDFSGVQFRVEGLYGEGILGTENGRGTLDQIDATATKAQDWSENILASDAVTNDSYYTFSTNGKYISKGKGVLCYLKVPVESISDRGDRLKKKFDEGFLITNKFKKFEHQAIPMWDQGAGHEIDKLTRVSYPLANLRFKSHHTDELMIYERFGIRLYDYKVTYNRVYDVTDLATAVDRKDDTNITWTGGTGATTTLSLDYVLKLAATNNYETAYDSNASGKIDIIDIQTVVHILNKDAPGAFSEVTETLESATGAVPNYVCDYILPSIPILGAIDYTEIGSFNIVKGNNVKPIDINGTINLNCNSSLNYTGGVALYWDPVDNAEYYTVYRQAAGESGMPILSSAAGVAGNITSFTARPLDSIKLPLEISATLWIDFPPISHNKCEAADEIGDITAEEFKYWVVATNRFGSSTSIAKQAAIVNCRRLPEATDTTFIIRQDTEFHGSFNVTHQYAVSPIGSCTSSCYPLWTYTQNSGDGNRGTSNENGTIITKSVRPSSSGAEGANNLGFTYMPKKGFIGKDTFNYTAKILDPDSINSPYLWCKDDASVTAYVIPKPPSVFVKKEACACPETGDQTITLKWDKVDGAESYKIYEYNTDTSAWGFKETINLSASDDPIEAELTPAYGFVGSTSTTWATWASCTEGTNLLVKYKVTSTITIDNNELENALVGVTEVENYMPCCTTITNPTVSSGTKAGYCDATGVGVPVGSVTIGWSDVVSPSGYDTYKVYRRGPYTITNDPSTFTFPGTDSWDYLDEVLGYGAAHSFIDNPDGCVGCPNTSYFYEYYVTSYSPDLCKEGVIPAGSSPVTGGQQVQITCCNRPPVAIDQTEVNGKAFETEFETALIGAQLKAIEPDSSIATYTQGSTTLGSSGGTISNFNTSTGTFDFTPAEGWYTTKDGLITFTWTATDNCGLVSNTGTADIVVKPPPECLEYDYIICNAQIPWLTDQQDVAGIRQKITTLTQVPFMLNNKGVPSLRKRCGAYTVTRGLNPLVLALSDDDCEFGIKTCTVPSSCPGCSPAPTSVVFHGGTYTQTSICNINGLSGGFNGNAYEVFTCNDGNWTSSGCIDPDACTEGSGEPQDCGNNDSGSQTRYCVNGQWGQWGPCTGADECQNDIPQTQSCGNNSSGTQTRICTGGVWPSWINISCENEDDCAVGETDNQNCGNNSSGTQIRPCTSGSWGQWGPCTGADECQNNNTQIGATACGWNGDGYRWQTCTLGIWVNDSYSGPGDSSCEDPDLCEYDSIRGEVCNTTGTRVAVCTSSGNSVWLGWSNCQDPTAGSGSAYHSHTISGISGTTSLTNGHTHEFTVDGSGNGYTDVAVGHHHKITGNTVANFYGLADCTDSQSNPQGSGYAEITNNVCGLNNAGYQARCCYDGQWGTWNAGSSTTTWICGTGAFIASSSTWDAWDNDNNTFVNNSDSDYYNDPADGNCWDKDKCTLGTRAGGASTTPASNPCGLNGNGWYDQSCTGTPTGWTNPDTVCQDPDAGGCTNNTEQSGGPATSPPSIPCGYNSNGWRKQLCVNAAWTSPTSGTDCEDPDECENGNTQACGSGGTQTCANEHWGACSNTSETLSDSGMNPGPFTTTTPDSSLSNLSVNYEFGGNTEIKLLSPPHFANQLSIYIPGGRGGCTSTSSVEVDLDGLVLDDEFTIDFWIRFNDVTGAQNDSPVQYIFTHLTTNSGTFLELQWDYTNTRFQLWTSNTSGSSFSTCASLEMSGHSITLTDDTWYHFAIIRDSNDLFYLYLNGEVHDSAGTKHGTASFENIDFTWGGFLRIGRSTSSSGLYPFGGYIDEFRIVKGQTMWTPGTNFTNEFTYVGGVLTDGPGPYCTGGSCPSSYALMLHFNSDTANIPEPDVSLDFSVPATTTSVEIKVAIAGDFSHPEIEYSDMRINNTFIKKLSKISDGATLKTVYHSIIPTGLWTSGNSLVVDFTAPPSVNADFGGFVHKYEVVLNYYTGNIECVSGQRESAACGVFGVQSKTCINGAWVWDSGTGSPGCEEISGGTTETGGNGTVSNSSYSTAGVYTHYWHLEELSKRDIHDNTDYHEYSFTERGKDVDVYVLDTGINYYHPMLQDRNGNSRVQSLCGADYYSSNFGTASHGTYCALCIGGAGYNENNPGGFGPGVAKECNFWSAKVCDGPCPDSAIVTAINAVINHNTESHADFKGFNNGSVNPSVINASFGGSPFWGHKVQEDIDIIGVRADGSDIQENAFKQATHPATGFHPVHIIKSAGNGSYVGRKGTFFSKGSNPWQTEYGTNKMSLAPGDTVNNNTEDGQGNIIISGATQQYDNKLDKYNVSQPTVPDNLFQPAPFSNYGRAVTCWAGGMHVILPDWQWSTLYPEGDKSFIEIGGTSFSGPFTAGIMALYAGVNPTATPAVGKVWLTNSTSGGTTLNQIDRLMSPDNEVTLTLNPLSIDNITDTSPCCDNDTAIFHFNGTGTFDTPIVSDCGSVDLKAVSSNNNTPITASVLLSGGSFSSTEAAFGGTSVRLDTDGDRIIVSDQDLTWWQHGQGGAFLDFRKIGTKFDGMTNIITWTSGANTPETPYGRLTFPPPPAGPGDAEPFTIDFWIRLDDKDAAYVFVENSQTYIYGASGSGQDYYSYFRMQKVKDDYMWNILIAGPTIDSSGYRFDASSVQSNIWHHIAMTSEIVSIGSGETEQRFRIFIDGDHVIFSDDVMDRGTEAAVAENLAIVLDAHSELTATASENTVTITQDIGVNGNGTITLTDECSACGEESIFPWSKTDFTGGSSTVGAVGTITIDDTSLNNMINSTATFTTTGNTTIIAKANLSMDLDGRDAPDFLATDRGSNIHTGQPAPGCDSGCPSGSGLLGVSYGDYIATSSHWCLRGTPYGWSFGSGVTDERSFDPSYSDPGDLGDLYIDELRIIKGTAKWTADFTKPTAAPVCPCDSSSDQKCGKYSEPLNKFLITVNWDDHGLTEGDKIRIEGATTFANLSKMDINGIKVVYEIVDDDNFKYAASGFTGANATSAAAGGNAVKIVKIEDRTGQTNTFGLTGGGDLPGNNLGDTAITMNLPVYWREDDGTFTNSDYYTITYSPNLYIFSPYQEYTVTWTTTGGDLGSSAVNTAISGYTLSATMTTPVGENPIAVTYTKDSNTPSWVSLDSSTGVITGTPTSTGLVTIIITATNGYKAESKTYTLNIT